MDKNPVLLYKTLVVGVIIFFLIGVAVQPGIATVQPEDIDVEYFEVTTEFIGLGKKHTTQLIKEEIRELDALFDSIGDSLNKSESIEETVEIFKVAVLNLDSFGLLGEVGIKETERLVTNSYQRTILMKTLERLYNRKKGTLGEDENRYCLIVGKITGALFISLSVILLVVKIMEYILEHGGYGGYGLGILFVMMILIPSRLIPFCLGRFIALEDWAKGKIITFGLNGLKYWNGKLKGKLKWDSFGDIGVLGFTGLKIEILTAPEQYFFGYAAQVHIDDS